MESIKGYLFTTEAEAISTIERINAALGFDVEDNSRKTQSYCNYYFLEGEGISGYYIPHDTLIEKVLNKPAVNIIIIN